MPAATLNDILKQYWNYDGFRHPQEEIIKNILEGKDVVALLKTGGGKSICFQLPAMMSEGLTIVISPLIALMQDQVENLQKRNIPAVFLNSSLLPQEFKSTLRALADNRFKLIFLSPEGLKSEKLLNILKKLNISRVVLDEAHCLSEWGHDFRPEYKRIATRLKSYGINAQIVAFTATATRNTLEEIIRCLALNNPYVSVSSFDRTNLFLGVKKFFTPLGKFITLKKIIQNSGKALIYCSTRDITESVASKLSKKFGNVTGFYHAGCSPNHRKQVQENFSKGKIKYLCATTAFGMGIDIPDIEKVIYWNCPGSIENYYQGIGRAGRIEALQAESWLLYLSRDISQQKRMLEEELPSNRDLHKIISLINNSESMLKIKEKYRLSDSIFNAIQLIIEEEHLSDPSGKRGTMIVKKKLGEISERKADKFIQLIKYISYKGCKRKFLLNYFNEEFGQPFCGKCSSCLK